ncbi:hypothetical protein EZV62_016804 [Acer yangbiense]|uniref:Integrase catalytic domain-containing protein n=1 Tax=Acer yangbiense TaxID=1000413 RepID=A0A5C7HQD3_9ROSI|nr:hypothetical protein EZV62_016804 [Acer yangbiense]
MSDYLMKKKSLIDALMYSGSVVSEDDKVGYILGGLGPEYDAFVIPITSMPDCYSLPDINALLLTHEARIDQHHSSESLTVNMATNTQGFNHFKSNNNTGYGRGNFQGKSHKLPFHSSKTVYKTPLTLIVADVWGPAPIASSKGYKYYLSLMDACTRYTWICLLKSKSEVRQAFLLFKAQVELQFDSKIKILQSDCGKEFLVLTADLQASGILFRQSCPYVHEQNGLIERKHRHLVETGLTLLAQASLPMMYWDEAFLAAVYLINRMPSSALGGQVPFQKLYHTDPDYSSLKVFGLERKVRKLNIRVFIDDDELWVVRLPQSIFTCNTLVELCILSDFVSDIPDSTKCFPSLKLLYISITNPDDDLLQKLFRSCPVLEDLSIHGDLVSNEDVLIFDIMGVHGFLLL